MFFVTWGLIFIINGPMGRCKERVTESMALKWLKRRLVKDGKCTRATKVKDVGYGGHLRLLWKPPKGSRNPPAPKSSEEEGYMSDEGTWSLPGLDNDDQ